MPYPAIAALLAKIAGGAKAAGAAVSEAGAAGALKAGAALTKAGVSEAAAKGAAGAISGVGKVVGGKIAAPGKAIESVQAMPTGKLLQKGAAFAANAWHPAQLPTPQGTPPGRAGAGVPYVPRIAYDAYQSRQRGY